MDIDKNENEKIRREWVPAFAGMRGKRQEGGEKIEIRKEKYEFIKSVFS
ncbi:hypothetical protein KAI58_04330 [Candidatus Gracilibacteria bacterium]|nr:hypothetical protein [Candidatus Gracilibacteria bacterium]